MFFRQSSIRLLISAILCAGTAIAATPKTEVEYSGRVNVYGTHSKNHASRLTPNTYHSVWNEQILAADASLGMRMKRGNLALHGELLVKTHSKKDEDVRLNEAHGELSVGGSVFLNVGRRVLSYGQSQGLNPVDIFHNPRADNRALPALLAVGNREGVDMAGIEMLLANGGSLNLLTAHGAETRNGGGKNNISVIGYSGLGAGGSLEYSIMAAGGKRRGIGMSISSDFGTSAIFYLDAMFLEGRDRRSVMGISPAGNPLTGIRKTWGTSELATIGMRKLFADGIDLSLEYSHDSQGYSDGEWDILMTVAYASSPPVTAIQGRRLAMVGELLNHFSLRKNYGFARVGKEGIFEGEANVEITVFHGFDDGSGDVGFRLERPLTEQGVIGVGIGRRYGGANSEFGLRPKTGRLSIYTSHAF